MAGDPVEEIAGRMSGGGVERQLLEILQDFHQESSREMRQQLREMRH